MNPEAGNQTLRFGRFEIKPVGRELRVDGVNVAVGARAFDLLLALAQRRGRLVSKQELLDLVRPGVVVEEHNIAARMSMLRKWLGPGVISTVPGRGCRFTAELEPFDKAEAAGGALGLDAALHEVRQWLEGGA